MRAAALLLVRALLWAAGRPMQCREIPVPEAISGEAEPRGIHRNAEPGGDKEALALGETQRR